MCVCMHAVCVRTCVHVVCVRACSVCVCAVCTYVHVCSVCVRTIHVRSVCVRTCVYVVCICGVSVSFVHIVTCTIHSFLCRYLNVMSVVYVFPPLQAKHDAQAKLRQVQLDLQQLQETMEEEQDSKAEVQKQLVAAKTEAALWKGKFEGEAQPRIEELEDAK